MLSFDEIRALQETDILTLQASARQAGIKFKNGALKKAEIIERLKASPSIGRATLATIARRRAGNAPIPPAPAPDINDWLDDSEEPAPQARIPDDSARQRQETLDSIRLPQIPQETHSFPREAEIIDRATIHAWLEDYALKHDVEQARMSVRAWAEREFLKRSESMVETFGEFERRIAELEKQKPIVFSVRDGASEIKPEGLTHPMLPKAIGVLMAGENVFLKGPAGSGKTTASLQCAKILGAQFSREDYTLHATGAVSDEFKLLGYKDAAGNYHRTPFRDAIEHGHLFLWDEIDASDASAVLVINSLDNGFVIFPDGRINIHPHFRLIAGGNTDGSGATMQFTGRVRMDGAFRDRFVIIEWLTDPRIEEHLSAGNTLWLACVKAVRAFIEQRGIEDVIATARATRRGPRLLAQGITPMETLEMTIKRGAIIEVWRDVLSLPQVRAFLNSGV